MQFLDGRGYDCEGRNWMALEASRSQHKEKVEHTINDIIKKAYNAIALVKAIVRRHQHSRFTTMTRFLVVENLDWVKGRIDLSRDWVRAGTEYEIEKERKAGKVVFRVQTNYYLSY